MSKQQVEPHAFTRHRSLVTSHAFVAVTAIAAATSGCGTAPRQAEPSPRADAPKVAKAHEPPRRPTAPRTIRGGGYYLDDGPGEAPPVDLDSVPEPTPQLEPLARAAMRPYVVLP